MLPTPPNTPPPMTITRLHQLASIFDTSLTTIVTLPLVKGGNKDPDNHLNW